MDFVSFPHENNKFEDDLKIFCYEMSHYIFARRFWYSKYPEPMPVTERSEFTEEFGKSVLAAWYAFGKRLEDMLEEDYPRYTCRIDNFERYVTLKVKDILNQSSRITLPEHIVMMSAILFDTYVYCYKKKYDGFLPDFVEFWTDLFLSLFYRDFNKDSGWKNLREGCLQYSKQYDEAEAEKSTDFGVIQVRPNYFKRDGTYKVSKELYCSSKLVSRFHTISKKLKKILPAGHSTNIRKREETLSIIYNSGKHKDVFELVGTEANEISGGMSQIITDLVKSIPNTVPTKKAAVETAEVGKNEEGVKKEQKKKKRK